MLGDSNKKHLCEMTHHEWKEEYYGLRCETCGEFIPDGCEPWMPDEDEDDEDYHSEMCTCEHCIQDYPERSYLIDDEDDPNWPSRDTLGVFDEPA